MAAGARGLSPAGRCASPRRGASGRSSGASCRRRLPTPNSSSASSGAASTASASRSSGARVQPTKGGPLDWSGVDCLVDGRRQGRDRRAAVPLRRAHLGGPAGRTFRRTPAPRTLPVRTGAAAHRLDEFLTQAVARYGPGGSFWAENPSLPKRPIRTWQIWNEPNFKYFVARPNPAEYGKLVKISYAAIKGVDPGREADPRRALRAAAARPTCKRKPPLAYFAADFLEQMYTQHARDQAEVPGRRPAPLHRRLQAADAGDRRSPRRAEGTTTPARGSGSPSSAGARKPPAGEQPFAKGRPARPRS